MAAETLLCNLLSFTLLFHSFIQHGRVAYLWSQLLTNGWNHSRSLIFRIIKKCLLLLLVFHTQSLVVSPAVWLSNHSQFLSLMCKAGIYLCSARLNFSRSQLCTISCRQRAKQRHLTSQRSSNFHFHISATIPMWNSRTSHFSTKFYFLHSQLCKSSYASCAKQRHHTSQLNSIFRFPLSNLCSNSCP
jgi:hypothetical protein